MVTESPGGPADEAGAVMSLPFCGPAPARPVLVIEADMRVYQPGLYHLRIERGEGGVTTIVVTPIPVSSASAGSAAGPG